MQITMSEKICLLVDDDLDDQEIFMMTLETVDTTVKCITSNNGAEALKLLNTDENFVPAYIFLDVNMPKMNGIECLKNILLLERFKSSKIYMYSTTSESNVVEQTKKLGVLDFIQKPARISELKVILSQIFNN
jgi:response regulator of citrate/malate metabolism